MKRQFEKMMQGESVDAIKQHWKQFLTGDDHAFKALYDHYIDRLFGWGHRFCNDAEAVKDSIQELFVDLYTYRRKLSAEVNVDAYLFASLRRKLIKQLKDSQRCHAANEFLLVEQTVEEDAEQRTIKIETDQQLMKALKKEMVDLPSRQQEVLFLRYTSELSYDAVSQIMKIPVTTCRTLLSRALRQLRKRMKDARLGNTVASLLFLFFYC